MNIYVVFGMLFRFQLFIRHLMSHSKRCIASKAIIALDCYEVLWLLTVATTTITAAAVYAYAVAVAMNITNQINYTCFNLDKFSQNFILVTTMQLGLLARACPLHFQHFFICGVLFEVFFRCSLRRFTYYFSPFSHNKSGEVFLSRFGGSP